MGRDYKGFETPFFYARDLGIVLKNRDVQVFVPPANFAYANAFLSSPKQLESMIRTWIPIKAAQLRRWDYKECLEPLVKLDKKTRKEYFELPLDDAVDLIAGQLKESIETVEKSGKLWANYGDEIISSDDLTIVENGMLRANVASKEKGSYDVWFCDTFLNNQGLPNITLARCDSKDNQFGEEKHGKAKTNYTLSVQIAVALTEVYKWKHNLQHQNRKVPQINNKPITEFLKDKYVFMPVNFVGPEQHKEFLTIEVIYKRYKQKTSGSVTPNHIINSYLFQDPTIFPESVRRSYELGNATISILKQKNMKKILPPQLRKNVKKSISGIEQITAKELELLQKREDDLRQKKKSTNLRDERAELRKQIHLNSLIVAEVKTDCEDDKRNLKLSQYESVQKIYDVTVNKLKNLGWKMADYGFEFGKSAYVFVKGGKRTSLVFDPKLPPFLVKRAEGRPTEPFSIFQSVNPFDLLHFNVLTKDRRHPTLNETLIQLPDINLEISNELRDWYVQTINESNHPFKDRIIEAYGLNKEPPILKWDHEKLLVFKELKDHRLTRF